MSRKTNYLWLDLETTGSDVATNKIIEVGCVLTDENLVILAEDTWVVNDGDALSLITDPVVVEMHTKNGLIDALPHGYYTEAVEAQIIDLLKQYGGKEEFGYSLRAGKEKSVYHVVYDYHPRVFHDYVQEIKALPSPVTLTVTDNIVKWSGDLPEESKKLYSLPS